MKVKRADNWKEFNQLKAENEAYKQRNRRYKFQIEAPNYLGYFDLFRIVDPSKCPRCHSSNIREAIFCVGCRHSNMECKNCGAFWQQELRIVLKRKEWREI